MTLRKRLILFFISLIGLLGLAQWWLLSTLTEQLEEGRREDAIQIGKALFDQLIGLDAFPPAGTVHAEHGLPPGLLEGVSIDELRGGSGIIIGGSSSMDWEIITADHLVDEEWVDGVGPSKISVMSSGPLGPDGKPIEFALDLAEYAVQSVFIPAGEARPEIGRDFPIWGFIGPPKGAS